MRRDNIMDHIREAVGKAGPFRIAVIIVCGILLIWVSCGDFFTHSGEKAPEADEEEVSEEREEGTLESYRKDMEKQVEELLVKVEGVGKVDVMLTLKASREKVTLKDSTVNTGKSEEESVLIEDENHNTSPYVVQEREPEIEGIAVVCGGGDNPGVQREIINAISALFPVESHKIKVMKSKEAK